MQPVAVEQFDERAGIAVAFQVVAHRIAETAVPFSPPGREITDLISPQIPGLGDDLDTAIIGPVDDLPQQRVGVEEAPPAAPVLFVRC